MSQRILQQYRLPLCRAILSIHALASQCNCAYSHPLIRNRTDIASLLSKPTWSVASLLRTTRPADSDRVSPTQLSHLLRLSALPQPKSDIEAEEMIHTLESQLHFVRNVQSVDTRGVKPLEAIRDETKAAIDERTITVETLKEALANEESKGKMRRPRRRRDVPVDTNGAEDWDIMGCTERKVGPYFVVDNRDR